MSRFEDTFTSADGKTAISVRLWCLDTWDVPEGYAPAANAPTADDPVRTAAAIAVAESIPSVAEALPSAPRGIVQIVHGMTEYVDRYDRVARYFNARGFIVVGNDHLAHGDSVTSPERRGCLEVGKGGDYLIEDVHTLRQIAQERFGSELPYFMFGHSMGSFVLRNYLARHGDGLSGAIICGTGQTPANTASMGNKLAKVEARLRGQDHRSTFLAKMMFGKYNDRIQPQRTRADWLTKDTAIVDAYLADQRCTFLFSSGGDAELTHLILGCIKQETFDAVDKDLPILVIAGGEDPVGDYGKGPAKVCDLYREAGSHDVTLKLFENDRHEIHNETDRDEVLAFLGDWLDDKAGSAQ